LKKYLAIVMLSGVFHSSGSAQWSDAGIGVIGAGHPDSGHRFGAAYVYGQGDKRDGITYHSLALDAEIRIGGGTDLIARIPFTHVRGPLGSVDGAGDLTLLLIGDLPVWEGGRLRLQVGGKFATGVSVSGSLPQSYQPGLGTTDLLLGSSLESGPWLVAVGYQLSRGRSDNPVTRLKRGDDLFSRLGYRTTLTGFGLGAELLAIKRLTESSILDVAVPASTPGTETFRSLPGSDQFQLNLLTSASLPLTGAVTATATGAFALLNREINIDGLTRGLTISMGLRYSP